MADVGHCGFPPAFGRPALDETSLTVMTGTSQDKPGHDGEWRRKRTGIGVRSAATRQSPSVRGLAMTAKTERQLTPLYVHPIALREQPTPIFNA